MSAPCTESIQQPLEADACICGLTGESGLPVRTEKMKALQVKNTVQDVLTEPRLRKTQDTR